MIRFINNMYSFILSILFWIFMWNLFDILFNELELSNKHKIIIYIILLLIIITIIYNDKDFFNYA